MIRVRLACGPVGRRAALAAISMFVAALFVTCGAALAQSGAMAPVIGLGEPTVIAPRATSEAPPSDASDWDAQQLSGLWYDATTNGQGVALELYPDLSGAGDGLVQAGWFVFDLAAGGVDRQHAYTLSGAMVEGAAAALLTIYRVNAGDGKAPSADPAQPAGTAMLVFGSCERAQLNYAFTDGSGRTGTIALARLAVNAACTMTAAAPAQAEYAFSGNWYGTANVGKGLIIEIDSSVPQLFLAWYADAANGEYPGAPGGQHWYIGRGPYEAGARPITVPLYDIAGSAFDAPDIHLASTVPVGTAMLAFQGCSGAVLTYAFNGGANAGRSGSVALTRLGAPAACASSYSSSL